MSDSPKDVELELREVVIALKDVAGEQWYDLGLQLRLPTFILDPIASHPVDARKRLMLRKWLQYDPEASWEKLVCALDLTGHKTTAASIRSQFVKATAEVANEADGNCDTEEADKIRECIWPSMHGVSNVTSMYFEVL